MDANGYTATSMKAKEALVCKSAFFKPPNNPGQNPTTSPRIAYLKVSQDMVSYALMSQSVATAPRPNKISFQILQIIWSWDKIHMTNMVRHTIRLDYHPQEWKKARGILLEKGGKRDFGLVRSYRVISLLNCMGKVVKKVVAEPLSHNCESHSKLHPGQTGGREERLAIDAVAVLVHTVQERWEDKKLAAVLFIVVKGACDHVSKA